MSTETWIKGANWHHKSNIYILQKSFPNSFCSFDFKAFWQNPSPKLKSTHMSTVCQDIIQFSVIAITDGRNWKFQCVVSEAQDNKIIPKVLSSKNINRYLWGPVTSIPVTAKPDWECLKPHDSIQFFVKWSRSSISALYTTKKGLVAM
jgi:hypothetical protein